MDVTSAKAFLEYSPFRESGETEHVSWLQNRANMTKEVCVGLGLADRNVIIGISLYVDMWR